ncbi:MAG: 4a-hydroxytetrahydrobiopterin dehydratase [Bdellovibrionia bacterium]
MAFPERYRSHSSWEQQRIPREDLPETLRCLKDWVLTPEGLVKKFSFTQFMEAVAFANQVAQIADLLDHHPYIQIFTCEVRVTIPQRPKQGLTFADLELAQKIDQL